MSLLPWIDVRVVARTEEATNIVSLELAAANDDALPAFAAGAHVDVQLAPNLIRQYSLCTPASANGNYLVAVLLERASRGGSRAMHALSVGSRLRIGAPRNLFPLASGGAPSVLFAGGIGITPILGMAERLTNTGAPFSLHYAARSRSHAAFVRRLESSAVATHLKTYFDDQRVEPAHVLASAPRESHVYVCGPHGFMSAIVDAARASGWDEARIHREVFVPETRASAEDGAFEVVIASTGKRILVAKSLTIVQALAEHGVEVPVSCEQGVCGTCLTGVLDGIPDHRDTFLTPSERRQNDQMTPCCSRAKSATLVLDL